jgi:hypothetical protein
MKKIFEKFISEMLAKPQIFPDFKSGLIHFASNRGCFARFLVTGRNYPAYSRRPSRILAPFFKLSANCRNIISMVFLTIVGNRALFPLSCRWLMPKYCSTIYRYFEIALFRLILKSVNFALTLSLRIIPFQIPFNTRNSRFGTPAYPLSA